MSWISQNVAWIFSGAGVAILGGILRFFLKKQSQSGREALPTVSIVNNNTLNTADKSSAHLAKREVEGPLSAADISKVKAATRVLFIDDDTKFKVVKIFKNSGWLQTSLVKDIGSMSDQVLIDADVVFVDVRGVGVALGFKDEGLGLAGALKDRYPLKKVVIYSSERKGEMFHQALRKADGSLEKNADPYEFERMLEGLVGIEE